MVDTLTTGCRSENMRRIRSKDTSPELRVRQFLHGLGLRYRLHGRDLPGKPDLVFPALRACVFVHGCFWHGCGRCVDGTRKVQSKSRYWIEKIAGNRARDQRHVRALRKERWTVYVIWECQLTESVTLRKIAVELLRRRSGRMRIRRSTN